MQRLRISQSVVGHCGVNQRPGYTEVNVGENICEAPEQLSSSREDYINKLILLISNPRIKACQMHIIKY
jgi:hypothetical protein